MGNRAGQDKMQQVVEGLLRQLDGKDHMIQHLLDRIDELERTIDDQCRSIEKMKDEIAGYTRMLFGTSSEKSRELQALQD